MMSDGRRTSRGSGGKLIKLANANLLVVGLGVAGSRHAKIARALGCQPAIASRRQSPDSFHSLMDGNLDLSEIDRIIVATETALHDAVFSGLRAGDFKGRVLIEKPGLVQESTFSDLAGIDARVGYNLRYLDSVNQVKSVITPELHPLRVSSRAFSYLPDWRPDSGSRVYYSQVLSLGGGALFDLSHELDLISYLLGDWRVLFSFGGKTGHVTQDADDAWMITGQSSSGAALSVNLSLNSKIVLRDMIFEFQNDSALLDIRNDAFHHGTVSFDGQGVERSYVTMLEDFLFGDNLRLPTLSENQNTLRRIQEIRNYSKAGRKNGDD